MPEAQPKLPKLLGPQGWFYYDGDGGFWFRSVGVIWRGWHQCPEVAREPLWKERVGF